MNGQQNIKIFYISICVYEAFLVYYVSIHMTHRTLDLDLLNRPLKNTTWRKNKVR